MDPKHIHPNNVVDVVHYRTSLEAVCYLHVDNVHSSPIVIYMRLATSFFVLSNRCKHPGFVLPGNMNSLSLYLIRYIYSG